MSTCSIAQPDQRSTSTGPAGVRPRVGLSPNNPQAAEGIRIEPPPSPPEAIGTIPAATAAAAPPLLPPGVRVVSQGLRVGPQRAGSVTGMIPSSGVLVLPRVTSPARLTRLTNSVSAVGT